MCAGVVRGWPEAVASFQPDAVVLLYGRAQIDDRLIASQGADAEHEQIHPTSQHLRPVTTQCGMAAELDHDVRIQAE